MSTQANGARLDLHVHSIYSEDGVLRPEEIVRVARLRGLGGVAITDHGTIMGACESLKCAGEDFKIIVGAEIMTDRGEVTGLFLSREIESRRLEDVIAEIRSQGGLVVVPHPFDGLRRSAFHITAEYAGLVDAIEGFNSRCVFQRYNSAAVEFAEKYALPVVGGSDAHYANEIGLGGIIVHSDDVRKAILDGSTTLFGTRSPLVNHVRTKARKLWGKAAG